MSKSGNSGTSEWQSNASAPWCQKAATAKTRICFIIVKEWFFVVFFFFLLSKLLNETQNHATLFILELFYQCPAYRKKR